MFSVLIVDDEELSLRTIRQMIDWYSIGVDCILEASNGNKAQQILKSHRVNLMVCDIEMPQMDGLELVEWLRAEQLDTEVIILTCHDSFEMAQKALHLGSVEYILKPVSPSALQESAERALRGWQEKEDYRGVSRCWDRSISFRRTQYFTDIIQKNISLSPHSLANHANAYGLSFDEKDRIQLALVYVENNGTSVRDMQDFMYSLQNVAVELWNAVFADWHCLIRYGDSAFWLVGGGQRKAGAEEEFSQKFEGFAEKHHLKTRVYMEAPCTVFELCGQAEKLQRIHGRRQLLEESVVKNNRNEREKTWLNTQARWRTYAEGGSYALIQEEITAAVRNLSGSQAQRGGYLKNMGAALLEAVKSSMYVTEDMEGACEKSWMISEQDSFYDEARFLAWAEGLLGQMGKYGREEEGRSSVISQICKYISMNIHRDISRETVAEAVHLNPDYVARLFKREMGTTLNSYIVSQRLQLARQLLAHTQIPVGDISGSLGYSSFSHFTKIFRESEGITPSEYRRAHKK